ncbi:MAG: DUF106 domain-containing protein [Candidatus Diapherotrites archaeon]|nr:DUF106 domain-containing protein [Candidatus Diapherotrites archaeon]
MLDAFSGILVIAFIMSAITVFLQYKIGSKQKIKQIQQEIKEKQKRLLELHKENKKEHEATIEKLQKEITSAMGEMMRLNSRFLIISMPLVLIVFIVLKAIYGSRPVILPYGIKLLAIDMQFSPQFKFKIFLSNVLGWLEWYIYAGIISSILMNFIAGKIMQKFKKEGVEKNAKAQ